jgi:hypothetical protein
LIAAGDQRERLGRGYPTSVLIAAGDQRERLGRSYPTSVLIAATTRSPARPSP